MRWRMPVYWFLLAFYSPVTSLLAQSCPTCTGGPGFTCSQGSSVVCANGQWTCSNGGTRCTVPPPSWTSCVGDWVITCTGSGWQCICPSCGLGCPLILDARKKGFHLTDIQHGVQFRFFPNNAPVKTSWTDPAFGNGFLVLDRNGNGIIDDGTELFGDLSAQPPSETPNGYASLAVFDERSQGGNEDGIISSEDLIFDSLRVWIDADQNGRSDPTELHTLRELGIAAIELKYHHTPFVDQFGNEFRYTGRMLQGDGAKRAATYDVFLRFDSGQDGSKTSRNLPTTATK